MAVNTEKLEVLDEKYNIQRPTYNKEDLEELQLLLSTTARKHPDWNDFWINDATILRFLKANVTVSDSHEAILNYCKWRAKNDVDNISPDDVDIKKEESIGRTKILYGVTDSYGRPVMVVYPRYHNKYHGNYESLCKYIIFLLEQLSGIADESGDGSFCLLFDLQGFSRLNMDYQGVKKVFWLLRYCYPERLGIALIVNYPWLFYGFWEVIKLWLNNITRSKILFCGENELKDFVDLKLIPFDNSIT